MTQDISCREIVEIITQYLEDALPSGERRRFEDHLAVCPGCRAYLDQMRMTIMVVGGFTVEAIAAADCARLVALFADWRGERDVRP